MPSPSLVLGRIHSSYGNRAVLLGATVDQLAISDSTSSGPERLHQRRFRRPLRWWELVLPAGLWINAARWSLAGARALRRSGLEVPLAMFSLVRLSARLSHIGFRVWLRQGGKWK
jgi:hypothetical protein